MPRTKDNPIPIELHEEDFEDDGYEAYLALGTLARESLTAEYEKKIADSQVAVTKAAVMERNAQMLEEANALTRWKWDG